MMLFGIMSDERVVKSKSPAMHNTVLRRRGLSGLYLPLKVEPGRVGPALAEFLAMGLTGANVTIPYKESVRPFLASLSPEAEAIGAVNTIVRRAEGFEGHNTDAAGFQAALLRSGFDPAGKKALIVGGGGAAKAAAYGLKKMGAARVAVCVRSRASAEKVRSDFDEVMLLEEQAGGKIETDLLINASPVSAPEEAPALAAEVRGWRLGDCDLVFDLNYGRDDNIWRNLAGRNRCGFIDGLIMLALQARASFELWTGLAVKPDEFIEALEEVC